MHIFAKKDKKRSNAEARFSGIVECWTHWEMDLIKAPKEESWGAPIYYDLSSVGHECWTEIHGNPSNGCQDIHVCIKAVEISLCGYNSSTIFLW